MSNWLATKLILGQRATQSNLAYIRAYRRFDPHNFEHIINGVTGGLSGSQSAQLSVANALGLNTSGLIIGGQVSGGGQSGGGYSPSGATGEYRPERAEGKITSTPPSSGAPDKKKGAATPGASGSGVPAAPPPPNPPLPF